MGRALGGDFVAFYVTVKSLKRIRACADLRHGSEGAASRHEAVLRMSKRDAAVRDSSLYKDRCNRPLAVCSPINGRTLSG